MRKRFHFYQLTCTFADHCFEGKIIGGNYHGSCQVHDIQILVIFKYSRYSNIQIGHIVNFPGDVGFKSSGI